MTAIQRIVDVWNATILKKKDWNTIIPMMIPTNRPNLIREFENEGNTTLIPITIKRGVGRLVLMKM